MKRLATALAVVFLGSSMQSIACAQHVPDDGTIPWGDPDGGFKIAISGPSTVQSGEPIPLKWWIGSLSKDTFRVALPRIEWTVFDPNGQPVPQPDVPHCCGGWSGSGIPGVNLSVDRAFRYKYDLAGGYKLDPGTYTVTVQWFVQRATDVYQFEYNHGSAAPVVAHPISKPIQITVE